MWRINLFSCSVYILEFLHSPMYVHILQVMQLLSSSHVCILILKINPIYYGKSGIIPSSSSRAFVYAVIPYKRTSHSVLGEGADTGATCSRIIPGGLMAYPGEYNRKSSFVRPNKRLPDLVVLRFIENPFSFCKLAWTVVSRNLERRCGESSVKKFEKLK